MTLSDTHDEIRQHCADIATLFKPGAKITVVVRNPLLGAQPFSADMCVGDDDIGMVIESLKYLATRDERR